MSLDTYSLLKGSEHYFHYRATDESECVFFKLCPLSEYSAVIRGCDNRGQTTQLQGFRLQYNTIDDSGDEPRVSVKHKDIVGGEITVVWLEGGLLQFDNGDGNWRSVLKLSQMISMSITNTRGKTGLKRMELRDGELHPKLVRAFVADGVGATTCEVVEPTKMEQC
jgi:hypothetical protein